MRRAVLLALVVSACSTAPNPVRDTIQVNPDDLAAIALQPGASEHAVPLSGPLSLTFILDVPADVDGTVPLVVAMPYAGDAVPSGRQYHQGLARPGLRSLGAIVVVPFAFDATWDTPASVAAVASFVEAAVEAWPVDPDRTVVTGYSNGGNGTWAQAALHGSLYSAAIPMASYAPTSPSTGTPLYVIHGETDELFPIERARLASERVREAGGQAVFEAVPFSHYEANRYVPALARAAAWVASDVWASSASRSAR